MKGAKWMLAGSLYLMHMYMYIILVLQLGKARLQDTTQ